MEVLQYSMQLLGGATVIGIASKKNSEYLRSLGAIPVAYEETSRMLFYQQVQDRLQNSWIAVEVIMLNWLSVWD